MWNSCCLWFVCVIVMFNFHKWLRDIWSWWTYKNEYMNFEKWFFFLAIKWTCTWNSFFLKDMYIQQKNLFNDVKMQLKANCMLLFGKKKIKPQLVNFQSKWIHRKMNAWYVKFIHHVQYALLARIFCREALW